MTFFGMMRVKNEARWIEPVIQALKPLCQHVFVFDDGSTDKTPAICQDLGATVYNTPFDGLNEARDKNWLLRKMWVEVPPKERGPESSHFIICVDGDEELEPGGADMVRRDIAGGNHALTLKIVYLWDRPDQIRTDGIYGRFTRGSVFRMMSPLHAFGNPLKRNRNQTNFHCGSIPWELMMQARAGRARLLHYGYMEKEDRLRKYAFYNAKDPGNKAENNYLHMVQGDIEEVPADKKLMHAGPLVIEPLSNVLVPNAVNDLRNRAAINRKASSDNPLVGAGIP